MKRYILTEYDNASSLTKEVYDDYMRTTGDSKVPVWLKSLGHNAHLVKSYWERAKGTLFYGTLPLPLKEVIVFVVSAINGANYCSSCHAQCVLNLDKAVSFEELKESAGTGSYAKIFPDYEQVINFVMKAAENPARLTDEDFKILLDDGFSKEELVEIISIIDLATMFNVYTSTLRLDLDPEYHAIL